MVKYVLELVQQLNDLLWSYRGSTNYTFNIAHRENVNGGLTNQ